jgi:hypothetical protein
MIELADEYDDSPWTREELQILAWEVGHRAGWDDADADADAGDESPAESL